MNFFNYLFKSSRSIINILFTIFIGLTFYFTLTSSNLLLNSQTTTWVTMVMLLGLVGIIIIMITDNFVKRFAHSVYQSGWLGEGTFIFTKTPASTWKWWAQTFTYPNGKNVSVFRFISQLIWIFLIGVLLFGWKYHDLISDGLRLSLIGGFLFLLIFEGGRSRYLIQFLPSIMILVLILWQSSREIITKILLATGLKKMEVSQNA